MDGVLAAVIDYLDHVEIGICHRVNRVGRTHGVRTLFATVSRLGDWSYWAVMGGLLLGLRGYDALPLIVHLGLTAAAGVVVYKLLKRSLIRERPFVLRGDILCGTPPLDRYSFPSGHTLHAVSFTLLFSHVEPAFLALCAPFAILVALSRVVLGLHYPSDVLVGAAIGAGLATLSIYLM